MDDASTDRSFDVLAGLARDNPRVKVIRFRANAGQTAAMMAGIRASRGEAVITMDADLQNDPADIPRLMAEYRKGFDLVSGWRGNRQDDYWTRVFPSRAANFLISMVSGVQLHDYGCTLKVYRGRLLRELRLYGEMHRFLPIYMAWQGARVTEVEVSHHPRRFGVSKYGLSRIFKVSLDLLHIKFLERYSTKPIHVFGATGLLCFALGVLLSALVLFQKAWYRTWVHRNPLFVISVFFEILAVQFVALGVLAELIVRSYQETAAKTPYKIHSTLNLPASCAE